MHAFLFAEGLGGLIAAVASYLWGYLDGRADVRAGWKKAMQELRDVD